MSIAQTVKFWTIGCKVNQYDTQNIREQFLCAGFKESDDNDKADIYVVNTCTVTHQADKDSLYCIRKAKKENPKAGIIVTGCLTELDEDKIKEIDRKIKIIKNKDKSIFLSQYRKVYNVSPKPPPDPRRFDSLLRMQNESAGTKRLGLRKSPKIGNRKLSRQGGIFLKLVPQKTPPAMTTISYFKGHTRAFLKIQDGCNNFCSYCKVPFVRGRSTSRPLNIVVKETKQLVQNGFKEIVLCGICLGSYGRDLKPAKTIVDVINRLEKIEGLLRLRLSSIEPNDVSDELIDKITHSRKLCPHLHIPLQSGDDEILRRMNRKYSADDYLALIEKIRKKLPDIAITTDVLAGFPGETEANFKNTVKVIKKISPLKVHIFPYSPRQISSDPVSPGSDNRRDRPLCLSDKIIKQRVNFLRKTSENLSRQYKNKFLGKTMAVLIEDRHKGKSDVWQGWTDNYIKVLVQSEQDLKNKQIYATLTLTPTEMSGLNPMDKDAVLGEISGR